MKNLNLSNVELALVNTNPDSIIVFNSSNKFTVLYESFLAEKFHGEVEDHTIWLFFGLSNNDKFLKDIAIRDLKFLLPDYKIY